MEASIRIDAPARALPVERSRSRFLPVDWLRGLVMVLMTVDHASATFNAGRLLTDSALLYHPGTALPAAQFFTRWITHLCAPTFVFLAGYVLFSSVERRRADGESPGDITRFIVTRGLLIAVLDPVWMVWVHRGQPVLQVLYAIGMSFVVLAFLCRLPPRLLGVLGLLLVVLHEALAASLAHVRGLGQMVVTLALVPGQVGPFPVRYPLLPWLAMMLLGWAAADIARREPDRFQKRLILAGLAALGVFAVVRGLNGYGNAGLFRDGASLIQWLHYSKYPPCLSYTACELGLAWLLLAAFWKATLPRWTAGVLTPLGQGAFFFYLLHRHLLVLMAWLLGLQRQAGLAATYLGAAVAIALLIPLCQRFRRYKVAHRGGWAQYI
jgi:uncharacterized membrane protein